MGMGRNTGFAKKGYHSGTPDDILKILSAKYSRELPHKFNFLIFEVFLMFQNRRVGDLEVKVGAF
jgi:hypothetical protein